METTKEKKTKRFALIAICLFLVAAIIAIWFLVQSGSEKDKGTTPSSTPAVTNTVPAQPSEAPNVTEEASPSEMPEVSATVTAAPTQTVIAEATKKPTTTPTKKPTKKPTATPTKKPTATPTKKPTATPTSSAKITQPNYSFAEQTLPNNSGLTFTSKMGAGWNLGNCLDASNCTWLGANDHLGYESAWCGVKASQALIDAVYNAGFRTIRIPVSWHNHVSSDGNFTINATWMARVKEVVNYAYNKGMYVIINAHHDNEDGAYYPDAARQSASCNYLTKVWTQIATTFKGYNEHLIFETFNEPRLSEKSDLEWWPYSNSSAYSASIAAINAMNQAAVTAIRATGGNNASLRYIMVTPYAAGVESACDYAGFVMPTDTLSNKLILSVHGYKPYNLAMNTEGGSTLTFTSADQTELKNIMAKLYSKYISKGIPVVIGEWGFVDKNNLQARVNGSAYYVGCAASYGIPTVIWDNNVFRSGDDFESTYGLFNRSTKALVFPDMTKAIMNAIK